MQWLSSTKLASFVLAAGVVAAGLVMVLWREHLSFGASAQRESAALAQVSGDVQCGAMAEKSQEEVIYFVGCGGFF